MNKKEFLEKIEQTYLQSLAIINNKNSDYATDEDPFKNFRSALIVGVNPKRAILVRSADKLSRISNLLDKENIVKDETILDSILDLIGYLCILKVWIETKHE